MPVKILFILISFSILTFPSFGQEKKVIELTQYNFPDDTQSVALSMAYADHVVKNEVDWADSGKIITGVDLVFTKYPAKKEDWITNYDSLLKFRIRMLESLAPQLKDNPAVKWNFILQTDCKNESEAKNLFHGAVIYFKNEEIKKPVEIVKEASKPLPKPVLAEIPVTCSLGDMVAGRFAFQDSVVLKVFERKQEWNNLVVVNDWTGSMYEYGCQALRWHSLNMNRDGVKMFWFFNDGDKKADHLKKIGKTGGIYSCPGGDIARALELMDRVMKKGYGGDIEENDLEAVIKAIKKSKGKGEYVLIADNKSHVRDMVLLRKIKVPVRVIICGARKGGIILPDYLELARSTGGSVHTIEEDIENLASLKEGDIVEILSVPHVFRNGRFERVTKPKEEIF